MITVDNIISKIGLIMRYSSNNYWKKKELLEPRGCVFATENNVLSVGKPKWSLAGSKTTQAPGTEIIKYIIPLDTLHSSSNYTMIISPRNTEQYWRILINVSTISSSYIYHTIYHHAYKRGFRNQQHVTRHKIANIILYAAANAHPSYHVHWRLKMKVLCRKKAFTNIYFCYLLLYIGALL